jgi:hypothetical protein
VRHLYSPLSPHLVSRTDYVTVLRHVVRPSDPLPDAHNHRFCDLGTLGTTAVSCSIPNLKKHSGRKILTHKFTHRERLLQSFSATWQPPRECKSLIRRLCLGSSLVVPAILEECPKHWTSDDSMLGIHKRIKSFSIFHYFPIKGFRELRKSRQSSVFFSYIASFPSFGRGRLGASHDSLCQEAIRAELSRFFCAGQSIVDGFGRHPKSILN